MTIIEKLILFFFIFLTIFIIFGLFRSIMKSSQQGVAFYQNLIERITQLRMHKMLLALGVNEEQYARSNSVNEIEKHMERCRQCANTKQCDTELESGKIQHANQYCPNNEDLLKGASNNL